MAPSLHAHSTAPGGDALASAAGPVRAEAGVLTAAQIRTVLLVQAIETAPRRGDAPPWSAGDAAAASAAASHAVGAEAGADAFLLARARGVLQQLAERVPGLPAQAPAGTGAWRGLLALGALGAWLLGVVADAGLSDGRIQLLALPLLGVLAWNLLVYLALALGALRAGLGAIRRAPGGLGRFKVSTPPWGGLAAASAALAGRLARWRPGAGPRWWQAALARQAALLQPVMAPVQQHQAVALLHGGAAVLALGLITSLYARGLVLDFRAGWDSTFLTAPQVRTVLGWVMAPAAWWPGLALPDAAQIASLRWADGSSGAPAAPWIHRLALTLLGLVVLPRLALAAWSAWRARQAARHLALPADEPYFTALRQQAPARAQPITVLPYNCHDSASRLAGLAAALQRWRGPGAVPVLQPVLPLGAEDALPAGLPPGGPADLVVLMSLNATPEREHHGALLARLPRHLPSGARCAVLLDSHAFDQRLAGHPDAAARRAQRIAAWQALLAEAGMPPAEVADLGAAATEPGPVPAQPSGATR